MPKEDIRSFFKPLTPKNIPIKAVAAATSSKKRPLIISSDDDDVVEVTPQKRKLLNKKSNSTIILSSDSEEDKQPKWFKPKKVSKDILKPVSAQDIFGSEPVKQSKIEKAVKPPKWNENSTKKGKKDFRKLDEHNDSTELFIHDDPDFEKSLLDLDEEWLNDLDKNTAKAPRQNLNLSSKISKKIKVSKTPNKKQIESPNIDLSNTQIETKHVTSPKNISDDNNPLEKQKRRNFLEPTSKNSSDEHSTPRKRKGNENSDLDPDQERYEKKIQSAILYQKYKNRGGPAHHGSKILPEGIPNCLKDLCFLRTGVLDSLESEEFDELVKKYGGRTVKSVSKKINYLVVGEEPGPAKMEKAKSLGIPSILEDEFLDLICTKSGLEPKYTTKNYECEPLNDREKEKISSLVENTSEKSSDIVIVNDEREPLNVREQEKINSLVENSSEKSSDIVMGSSKNNLPTESTNEKTKAHKKNSEKSDIALPADNMAWTDKYKPTNIKGIIGQQGEGSNMNKLMKWLQNWDRNHLGKNKPKLTRPSPWAKNDDGAYYKCALLSGPPGVGKTTTTTLVCKHMGFDVVEFNASDTRSKKSLQQEVSQVLTSKSISAFVREDAKIKRVLVMDEVDGMAGNEDRGGMQELINLIKNTSVPIICMCNDRNHQKIRSLANYCFDLRFSKPRLEPILGAMSRICFLEKIKLPPGTLNQIIKGTGMDVRQTLNHLFLWTKANKILTAEQAEKEAIASKKDTVLGPWEVCKRVFSAEEHKTMSLIDKAQLFFYDYNIGPLFVQENYIHVLPNAPKKEFLLRAAETADAISMSDLIDVRIRSTNNWSLLDAKAMYASVLPGHYMEGHVSGQINFPSWLGKNSKRTKCQRLLCELYAHTRIRTSGSKVAINLDYRSHLYNRIIVPLIKEGPGGIDESLEVMKTYSLLREDLDNLSELSQWPRIKDLMTSVDSKVKAAFTRTYNKKGVMLPYSVSATAFKKKNIPVTSLENEYLQEGEKESESEEEDSIENIPMIKVKTKTGSKNVSKKDEGASTSKTKSRSKAPAKGKKK